MRNLALAIALLSSPAVLADGATTYNTMCASCHGATGAGDGAAAVLLEPCGKNEGIIDSILKSDGSGRNFLKMNAGGSLNPATINTVKNKQHFVNQE